VYIDDAMEYIPKIVNIEIIETIGIIIQPGKFLSLSKIISGWKENASNNAKTNGINIAESSASIMKILTKRKKSKMFLIDSRLFNFIIFKIVKYLFVN